MTTEKPIPECRWCHAVLSDRRADGSPRWCSERCRWLDNAVTFYEKDPESAAFMDPVRAEMLARVARKLYEARITAHLLGPVPLPVMVGAFDPEALDD